MARTPQKNGQPDHRHRIPSLVVCGFLLLAVGLVFGQTIRHEFINFDDNAYVYDNPHIARGLTVDGIGWAFTNCYAANWHPLTWLSHILDYELYGLYAGGHHATSVLLHAAAAILLFFALRRMTSDLWPSAFVAAIFAIHPLRVESVAWVAERKDVLSGLFFMLTLLAYADYVRCPFSLVRYLAVVAFFALGLMAKPMLVTLPLVLLLLDYWPLGRMVIKPLPAVARCWGSSCTGTPEATGQLSPQRSDLSKGATAGRGFMTNVWFLVLEKIPLFVLAAASCVATMLAQGPTVVELSIVPLSARITNAPVSYVAYLGRFFYPVNLAAIYPHHGPGMPLWKAAAALAALTAISIAALAWRRRRPSVLVGWFWYLGMLVPVIGLVQVGAQAMADRYTYLPQIGLCIAMAWGTAQAIASWPYRRWACGIGSVLVLMVLAACGWRQTTFWRNNETLWTHTVACTSRNGLALCYLGSALDDQGRTDEAIAYYRSALQILPDCVDVHCNLGVALAGQGRIEEAMAHYRRAVEVAPERPEAYCNLGLALAGQGRLDEAMAEYRKALKIKPDYAEAHNNLGAAFAGGGQFEAAAAEYRKALKIKPDFAAAHYNLSLALSRQGKLPESLAERRELIRLCPNDVALLNDTAWMLATSANSSIRNGAEAVELARRAAELSGGQEPAILGTLAAAYAEAGRFSEAVQTARTALDLATRQNKQSLAKSIKAKLLLYEAKTPYREPPESSSSRSPR